MFLIRGGKCIKICFYNLQTVFAKKVNMRPVAEIVNQIYHPKFGIVFTNGEEWKTQRKTFVRLMKKTGFQKPHLESVVDYIWPRMREPISKNSSIVVGLDKEIKSSSNDALEQVELALMELLTLIFADKSLFPNGIVPNDYLNNFNTYRTCGVQWIDANALWYRFPILRHLAPELSGFVWIKDMIAQTEKNMNEIVSLHKRAREIGMSTETGPIGAKPWRWPTSTSPRSPPIAPLATDEHPAGAKRGASYVDSYLEEIDRIEGEDAKNNHHRAMIASLEEIFLGADGIVMGFYSLLYCLARNPHVQEEMRKEISVATEILPYCRAVILETLRYVPQGGIGPQHYSEEDLLVDGYKIPAGMDVYPNVMGIFQSREHWDQPELFNPMRFLGQDRQLLHPKTWIPFSIGDRTCPAKSFSQDVLLMLGLKLVTEFELAFEGFVEKGANEFKYYGMSLAHINPFKIAVRELSPRYRKQVSRTISATDHPGRTLLRMASKTEEL